MRCRCMHSNQQYKVPVTGITANSRATATEKHKKESL